ncbi:hypothetical protein N7493_002909 [Penicillium malachiteum]|uniref:Uncharacterized protein n=1 Tax=Penicillium malachiteum TaxID=1324776 RepID=A0AAD6HSR1_9EURO|nr:hypothetical protein N7493_002909 [Penicillium malachiteum]
MVETVSIVNVLASELKLVASQGKHSLSMLDLGSSNDILAELYLKLALAALPQNYWCRRFEEFMEKTDHTKSPAVSCCFARYLLVVKEIARAKKAVREMVIMALEMLFDHDPSNDMQAFIMLYKIMVAFGDLDRMKSIMRVANLARLSWWTRTENGACAIQADPCQALYFYDCTGCGEPHSFTKSGSRSFFVCADCAGTSVLHPECYQKQQNLKPEEHTCFKHDFLHIPAMFVTTLVNTLIPTDSGNVTLKRWKEDIRRDFLELES